MILLDSLPIALFGSLTIIGVILTIWVLIRGKIIWKEEKENGNI